MIKAVLARRNIAYTRTHRLGELVDLAADHGVRFPDGIEFLVDLTPYAVEFRYDAAPDEGCDELDKQEVLDRLRVLRAWVIGSAMGSAPHQGQGSSRESL